MNFYNLEEFLSLPAPNIKAIVEPQILVPGGSLIIYGKAATFKSWLAIDLAFSINSGADWLGYFPTKPKKVLVFQTEQASFMYQKRIKTYYQHWNRGILEPTRLQFHNSVGVNFTDPRNQALIEAHIKEYRPDVFILDNLFRVTPTSDSDEVAIKNIFNRFAVWQEEYRCSFVIIHHPRKEGVEERGFDDMRGSGILNNWVDTILRTRPADFATSTTGITSRVNSIQLKWEKGKNFEEADPDEIIVGLNRTNAQLYVKE